LQHFLQPILLDVTIREIGPIQELDILNGAIMYGLGICWLWIACVPLTPSSALGSGFIIQEQSSAKKLIRVRLKLLADVFDNNNLPG
jgi:hypothetical protein